MVSVSVSELQVLVEAEYGRLELPSWPNPHAGMFPPDENEYSRVTDPERYRIVHARASVWAAVLEDALDVSSETLAAAGGAERPHGFDRGVGLIPCQPGTLPLFLLERDVPTQTPTGEGTLALLDIGVGRPDIVVSMQPDCGCDACDSGSSDLLEAIDARIRHVVGGPFVVLRGTTWRAEWHPGGGSAGGEGCRPDFRQVMELCRRLAASDIVHLPEDTEALVGQSWLS
ncbi:DUF6226 family protein [Nocardioides allogilvus]|uniref:DUF6226 family protein n=1 Tax=Nocardioides allogilvus TaxID=2072017 RepID=UPI000D312E74|nr:DUF6226 family protein [Nocardioides allogilvus]